MLSARLLLSFVLTFLPVFCLGQESPKTSAVPETCAVTKPCNATVRATTALSRKTIPWPILVRDGQAMDRFARHRSVGRVGALHPHRSDFQTEAGFLARRTRRAYRKTRETHGNR